MRSVLRGRGTAARPRRCPGSACAMTDATPTGSSCARPVDSPAEVGGAWASDPGFAIIEMFTSQGCSSCPPAEEVLSEIERDARERGQRVFALGFHVDYWDYLGWADPFADEAYTARQQAYARAFGAGQVYTPSGAPVKRGRGSCSPGAERCPRDRNAGHHPARQGHDHR
ncbi:DUF1223 domain-containing protein [Micromonospora sp. NPDC004704]